METGAKSFTNYLEVLFNHKIQCLAEIIEREGHDPYVILSEAANEVGIDFDSDWQIKHSIAARKKRKAAWADYEKRKKEVKFANQRPITVPELVDKLKHTVKQLVLKGVDDSRIHNLVIHAMKNAERRPYGSSTTVKSHYPSNIKPFATDTDTHGIEPFTADTGHDASQVGDWEYGGIGDPKHPHWFDNMTNAEKKWYRKLTPRQKEHFIMRHDQMVFGEKGHTPAGFKHIDPSHPDFKDVQDIAHRTHARNPWMQNRDATLKAAAGLWNRHKIRKDLQKDLDNWGEEPLPVFDDLLHKDHTENNEEFLSEWCNMAGIKKRYKKDK